MVVKGIPLMLVYSEILGSLPFPWLVRKGVDLLFKLPLARHRELCRRKLMRRLKTSSDRKDFVSYIDRLDKEHKITDDEFLSEMSVLVLAGSETSSMVLTSIVFYLLKNPEAYDKLRYELRSTFTDIEAITAHALNHLSFLHAVVDEGLRLFPPAPSGMTRLSPGTQVDGHWVPRGITVSSDIWTIHHSEKYFHRPLDFLPERWIDPTCTDKKQASRPFLIGKRACIGRNMALLEIRLTLAKILFMFDFELADPNMDWMKQVKWYWIWTDKSLRVRVRKSTHP